MRGSDECARCGSTSSVIDTRRSENQYLRRRRECDNKPSCGVRWTTIEMPKIKEKDSVKLARIKRVLAEGGKG